MYDEAAISTETTCHDNLARPLLAQHIPQLYRRYKIFLNFSDVIGFRDEKLDWVEGRDAEQAKCNCVLADNHYRTESN